MGGLRGDDGRCELYGEAGMRRANKEKAGAFTRSDQAGKPFAQSACRRAPPYEGIQNFAIAMTAVLERCSPFVVN